MPVTVFFIIALVLIVIIAGLWLLRRRTSSDAPAVQTAPPPQIDPTGEEQRFNQRQNQLAAIAEEKGWTTAAYDHVLDGQIAPGMTQDMVLLAWGGPTSIDHRATNQKGVPVERWVYQMPTTGKQQYVWFASGRIIRVEEG